MASGTLIGTLPLAATMDLQYRLPPFQQIFFTPTIIISCILLGLAIIAVMYLSHRSRILEQQRRRRDAIKTAEKLVIKRGGSDEDVQRISYIFKENPHIDPSAVIMLKDRFAKDMMPLLEKTFDQYFANKMESLYFPPPPDSRRFIRESRTSQRTKTEDRAQTAPNQTAATILDLMDATLRPGVIVRLTFEGIEGGYECMVMGHDLLSVNVTLPANSDQLIASLRPGMHVDGNLESGPSLFTFTADLIQAVAGSMPYCRITAWKSAMEVRKRQTVRLPISLDIDMQHISTARTDSINMSNLEKEIGSIRPGHLVDISLGGCGIETASIGEFRVGDLIRFSKSLVTGNPPATLLGSVVKIDAIPPQNHDGNTRRLHVQFLVIDDVSQRILVRTLRQLQDLMERDEWMQAQQLLQKMRRNKIQGIGGVPPLVTSHTTKLFTPLESGSEGGLALGKTIGGTSSRTRKPEDKPKTGSGTSTRSVSDKTTSTTTRLRAAGIGSDPNSKKLRQPQINLAKNRQPGEVTKIRTRDTSRPDQPGNPPPP